MATQFNALMTICKQHKIQGKLGQLKDVVLDIRRVTYEDRTEIERRMSHENACQNVVNFLQKADTLDRTDKIRTKTEIYLAICCIKNNTMKIHEKYAIALAAGIADEAAKDLITFHSCHQTDRLAGALIASAFTTLSITTRFSKGAAIDCHNSKHVKKAVYFYLDPNQNVSFAVLFSALIIDHMDQKNRMHEMLFYGDFLDDCIHRASNSEFDKSTEQHGIVQENKLNHDNMYFTLDITMRILNILARSNDYRCYLHTRLLDASFSQIIDGVFKRGTEAERREVSDLMKKMCTHKCREHSNEPYIKNLLTLVVGIRPQDVPTFAVATLPRESFRDSQLFQAHCDLGKKAMTFLQEVLKPKIPDTFINHDHNRCFCDGCMADRGDDDVYTRGDPPKAYALPRGWFRFVLIFFKYFIA